MTNNDKWTSHGGTVARDQKDFPNKEEESPSSESLPSAIVDSVPVEFMTLEKMMESTVRVTLAGLGGSMLGLSQERKLESMRVVTGAAATAAARRKRAPSAQLTNLSLTWALSCMAFCAIIETCRRLEPSSRLMAMAYNRNPIIDNWPVSLSANSRIQEFAGTVADFSFAGAVGGLAASTGRNTHLRKQLPSSMLRGSQRFFGVLPGLGLGFIFGILQATTDAGITYLEEQQKP